MTKLENGVLLSWVDLRTDPFVSRGRDEGAPGPIYLQGDHGRILYRNIVLTPAS